MIPWAPMVFSSVPFSKALYAPKTPSPAAACSAILSGVAHSPRPAITRAWA